jgi:hypothetical protein
LALFFRDVAAEAPGMATLLPLASRLGEKVQWF